MTLNTNTSPHPRHLEHTGVKKINVLYPCASSEENFQTIFLYILQLLNPNYAVNRHISTLHKEASLSIPEFMAILNYGEKFFTCSNSSVKF